ncbi:hypothetical protein DGWBC_0868 [Dehalogenimonas sp. WBC-2]|nr:hypothetical protein DGWBC_0868 [Dehalogenimonas sp. WBC-2]
MTVYEKLANELSTIGCRYGILDVKRVTELKEELWNRFIEGQFDESFFDRNLKRLDGDPPKNMPEARSIIIIAAPLPFIQLSFSYRGKIYFAGIPPYYTFSNNLTRIRKALGRSLGADGHRIIDARIPYKLAAVRCGLAVYGQNNLTYVDGMGSFHRLVAFYSTLTAPEDLWIPSQLMDACADCGFCRGNCPTGCLVPMSEGGRFIARSEKCITLYNEEPGTFPEWLGLHLHNAIIGCMRCQSSCPVDRPLLRDIKVSEVFNEQETMAIIEATPFDDLSPELKEKLTKYNLDTYYNVIPRNLRAILEGQT